MTPRPGDVLILTTWSGNQPPRPHHDEVRVVVVGHRWARIEHLDDRPMPERTVSAAWLARHARRPLDPTPPGPPVDGEQTELELEIR